MKIKNKINELHLKEAFIRWLLRTDKNKRKETVMDKNKTRLEELEDMLRFDGELNRNIYNAVINILNETDSKLEDKRWEELDIAFNSYVKCYVEYDRLKQSCKS